MQHRLRQRPEANRGGWASTCDLGCAGRKGTLEGGCFVASLGPPVRLEEVGTRFFFFWFVYLSRGTLPQERNGRRALLGDLACKTTPKRVPSTKRPKKTGAPQKQTHPVGDLGWLCKLGVVSHEPSTRTKGSNPQPTNPKHQFGGT